MKKEELYPLLFEPYYKEVMWGGSQMAARLNRNVPAGVLIGEAWEICDRPEFSSPAVNGPLAGKTLRELISVYGRELMGSRFEGGEFPLLVKLIDAGKKLSLQVHPDEDACEKIGGSAQPKTEMWYIMAVEEGAEIIAGVAADADREKFFEKMVSGDVTDMLRIYKSSPGDTYFIRAGLVHAIGAGNLLLEVQQNSDTTYRISEWGRLDSNGKPRQLHVEESGKCINFSLGDDILVRSEAPCTEGVRIRPVVGDCPFFKVDEISFCGRWHDSTEDSGSFHLITAVNFPVRVGRDGRFAEVPAGSTCLVPACFGKYTVSADGQKGVTLVRTSL